MSHKQCRVCGECKPLNRFGCRSDTKKYRTDCKDCIHRRDIRRRYGMSTGQYEAMLESQGGVCAICASDDPGRHSRFVVDHDHETGEVRALLCNVCNLLIGWAQEDPQRLAQAAEYVRPARVT